MKGGVSKWGTGGGFIKGWVRKWGTAGGGFMKGGVRKWGTGGGFMKSGVRNWELVEDLWIYELRSWDWSDWRRIYEGLS